jgi:HAD superfamily hydrolase (TIGR01490 family)
MSTQYIALFDFCDTLIKGQSISMFLDYLYTQERNLWKKFNIRLNQKFNLYRSNESLNYKNHLLKAFRYLDKNQLEILGKSFFYDVLLKNVRQPVIKCLEQHKANNIKCVIVSGGFDIYLTHFASHYGIEHVISSRLKFEGNQFLGKIDGEECLGKNKITKLNNILALDDFDLENSYAYSDHSSDKYLLSLVGNAYVIDYGQNISWNKDKWEVIRVVH